MVTSAETIDRRALVERNNPVVQSVDTLASLSVGNGGFAVTVDVNMIIGKITAIPTGCPMDINMVNLTSILFG